MEITTDFIMNQIKEWVSERQPISPEVWLDAAAKLNILISEEQAQMVEKEFQLAQFAADMALKSPEMPVAKIKLQVAINPLYRDVALLKAKIGRVNEMIKVSKIQARMNQEEYKRQ
jgi:hypothetical protein